MPRSMLHRTINRFNTFYPTFLSLIYLSGCYGRREDMVLAPRYLGFLTRGCSMALIGHGYEQITLRNDVDAVLFISYQHRLLFTLQHGR